LGVGQKNTFS